MCNYERLFVEQVGSCRLAMHCKYPSQEHEPPRHASFSRVTVRLEHVRIMEMSYKCILLAQLCLS